MPSGYNKNLKGVIRVILYGLAYFFLQYICPAYTQVAEDPIAGVIEKVMEATPVTELKRLRENLLDKYEKTQRPAKDTDAASRVLIYFDARHIISLEEKFQTLTVEGVLMMKWEDERLKWDPSSYSGIKIVRLRTIDVWLPDIYSLFSVKKNDMYNIENVTPVQVYSNGTVKWFTQTTFDLPCSAKYKHFPFDSHNCSIVFGSWTHTERDIILQILDRPPSTKTDVIGTEWKVTGLTHGYENFSDGNSYNITFVRVDFYLKRTSTIYRYVCTVPTFIVFISSLSGFWLLPSDGSRYLIGCSNVLLMSLLLQYLAMTVHAGYEIPLIAQYSATCLSMSGVFLLISVVTEIIRNFSGPPPHYLVRLAHQHMDQYLCLFSFSDSSVSRYSGLGDASPSSDATPQFIPEEEKRKKDWMVVSLVVDRISFWVFTFVYVVLLGVLASV